MIAELSECKLCKSKMRIRESEFGSFFGCEKYPTCKNKLSYDYVVKEVCKSGVEFYCEEGNCGKCSKKTKIYAYSIVKQIGNIFDFDSKFLVPDQGPESFRKIDQGMTKNISNIKNKYSNTQQRAYIANVCEHCDALQGEGFLFNEPDSPFGNLLEKEPKFIEKIIF